MTGSSKQTLKARKKPFVNKKEGRARLAGVCKKFYAEAITREMIETKNDAVVF